MIEGGCLCGAVRYSCEAEPVMQAVCHCKNCQKQAGTAYSVIIGVPRQALKLTGELTTYEDKGDSGGRVSRSFCPRCGSPVLSDVSVAPALVFIKAGTLDDTSWVTPAVHMFTRSAMACSVIPEGVAKFETTPG
jgi:hypothetical protein